MLTKVERTRAVKEIRTTRAISEAWIVRFQEGDPAAAGILVEAHQPLVAKTAMRYCRPDSRDWDDCLQEGSLGVLRGAETFEPGKGAPTTYLMPWIRHKVQRFLINCAQGVRIPSYQYQRKNADGSHAQSFRYSRTALFTDLSIGRSQDEPLPFEDTLVAPDAEPERDLADLLYARAMAKLEAWFLVRLKAAQAEILARRCSDPEETLQQIGESRGVSRERIRQVETEALEECKRLAKWSGFDPSRHDSFEAWVTRASERLWAAQHRARSIQLPRVTVSPAEPVSATVRNSPVATLVVVEPAAPSRIGEALKATRLENARRIASGRRVAAGGRS
jgi:RNA polymerase primary sigma factor